MTVSARWIRELQRQLKRGKHVVLHGNVRDLVLLEGQFLPFDQALQHVLAELGYTLRCHYNQRDGIRFADEPQGAMRRRFEIRLRGEEEEPPGPAYRLPGRRAGEASEESPTPALYLQDIDDALAALRLAMGGTWREPMAAVLACSDKLVAGGSSQPANEREWLVELDLIAGEARRVSHHGPMEGMRNALVMVAPGLGQVPAWLYRDNPLFQVVAITRPDGEERQEFFRQQFDQFHGVRPGEEPGAPLLEELATLTDGLTHWDLEAMRLTSHHEALPVSAPRRLVDFFKHGTREDPWERLGLDTLHQAEATLRQTVIGQEAAIQAVCDVLIAARGGVQLEGAGRAAVRPKGVLFFVGPTGVGKTELAKAMTELIFKDPTAFARFDMSEYAQEHAAERLTGAPPSYVGYEAGGQLTNRMKARPFSLILFDEIEKAHPRIMDKFLQVLDDGRLTDGLGDTVYFSQSVIVFTSNIGSTRADQMGGRTVVRSVLEPGWSYEQVQAHYREEVKAHFIAMGRPELLGRIGEENVVVFDMLRDTHIAAIADKFLRGLAASALEKYAIALTFDPSILAAAQVFCRRPEVIQLGGRGIRNFAQAQLLPRVNEAVLRHPRGARLVARWTEAGVVVEAKP